MFWIVGKIKKAVANERWQCLYHTNKYCSVITFLEEYVSGTINLSPYIYIYITVFL